MQGLIWPDSILSKGKQVKTMVRVGFVNDSLSWLPSTRHGCVFVKPMFAIEGDHWLHMRGILWTTYHRKRHAQVFDLKWRILSSFGFSPKRKRRLHLWHVGILPYTTFIRRILDPTPFSAAGQRGHKHPMCSCLLVCDTQDKFDVEDCGLYFIPHSQDFLFCFCFRFFLEPPCLICITP